MIKVLLVDDHTAVRAGLGALLRLEPGFVSTGAAGSAAEAVEAARRARPDVVIADYHLMDGDGLSLCRTLKHMDPAPAVLVYSAFASGRLALAALVAGSDGLLEKGASADELFDAIRTVAGGRPLPFTAAQEQFAVGAVALEPEDLPILGMRAERTPVAEIAATLRVPLTEVEARIDAMVRRLRPPIEPRVPVGAQL